MSLFPQITLRCVFALHDHTLISSWETKFYEDLKLDWKHTFKLQLNPEQKYSFESVENMN